MSDGLKSQDRMPTRTQLPAVTIVITVASGQAGSLNDGLKITPSDSSEHVCEPALPSARTREAGAYRPYEVYINIYTPRGSSVLPPQGVFQIFKTQFPFFLGISSLFSEKTWFSLFFSAGFSLFFPMDVAVSISDVFCTAFIVCFQINGYLICILHTV
jgi:hypothetical protein